MHIHQLSSITDFIILKTKNMKGNISGTSFFLIVLSNSYLVSLLEDYGLCFTIPVFSVPPRSTKAEFLPGQQLFQWHTFILESSYWRSSLYLLTLTGHLFQRLIKMSVSGSICYSPCVSKRNQSHELRPVKPSLVSPSWAADIHHFHWQFCQPFIGD